MKQLLFVVLLTATFFSCKKEEATTVAPKKTYTVIYEITCTGYYNSIYNLNYKKNGVSYSQLITIPCCDPNNITSTWTSSFIATTGDYVSMSCKPPYSAIVDNYVSLSIKYDGGYYWSYARASTPITGGTFTTQTGTASCSSTLP